MEPDLGMKVEFLEISAQQVDTLGNWGLDKMDIDRRRFLRNIQLRVAGVKIYKNISLTMFI